MQYYILPERLLNIDERPLTHKVDKSLYAGIIYAGGVYKFSYRD